MSLPGDEGGRAFPGLAAPGMSLRDWLAGHALQGLLAHGGRANVRRPGDWKEVDVEGAAYEIADRMIRARKGEGP